MALVAFRARQGDRLTIAQNVGTVPGADDGRHAELAADDGGVARGAAVVRDDAGRLLHDQDPVRVGHLGDQDRPWPEAVDVLDAADDAGVAGGDALADGGSEMSLHQPDGDLPGRRTAPTALFPDVLNHVDLAGLPVLCPFHVHRPAVMALDGCRPAAKLENLVVAEHEGLPLPLRGLDDCRARAPAAAVDELALLAAPRLLDDRPVARVVEKRQVDDTCRDRPCPGRRSRRDPRLR